MDLDSKSYMLNHCHSFSHKWAALFQLFWNSWFLSSNPSGAEARTFWITSSIPMLNIPCLLIFPSQLQPCRINASMYTARIDFNGMGHLNVEQWYKTPGYIFHVSINKSASKGFSGVCYILASVNPSIIQVSRPWHENSPRIPHIFVCKAITWNMCCLRYM